MEQDLRHAFSAGYERLASWADLLDRINVFPVADSDTGCNLRISLAPLRQFSGNMAQIIHSLLVSATGNSGNIAARFFAGFLTAESSLDLSAAARAGRDYAWQAIGDPKPGTMLTVFDELARVLDNFHINEKDKLIPAIIDRLKEAVLSTTGLLAELKSAGVVDAGALGMFIYLEGFFRCLVGREERPFLSITDIFRGRLSVSASYQAEAGESHCVDTLIRVEGRSDNALKKLSSYGQSVVAYPDNSYLKIHLHTDDPGAFRQRLESLGDIVKWSEDRINTQVMKFPFQPVQHAVHIMTDAAGSITRKTAGNLGMTLLDSYIIFEERSIPETLFSPSELYSMMRKGTRVSTAQASTFERSQCYDSVLEQYRRVLYLCVGSAFTGNFNTVMAWKHANDPDNRLMVIDTGAASGRLGLVAIAVARYSNSVNDGDQVIDFAEAALENCEEYVFLDRLEYLAAGGRLSKAQGFFGDLLHMKPVISPTPRGARKVGVVRDREGQLEFAVKQLKRRLKDSSNSIIMLEYSDNSEWVTDTVEREVRKNYPKAEILFQPLSLTSGVHMGPGAWAVAFLPEKSSIV